MDNLSSLHLTERIWLCFTPPKLAHSVRQLRICSVTLGKMNNRKTMTQKKEYLNEEQEKEFLKQFSPEEAEQYSSRCVVCGKRQFRFVLPPKEVEIELWVWNSRCWNCKRVTPVAYTSPDATVDEFFNVDPNSFEELPRKISEKYPFFKRVYSKTRGEWIYGNVCAHCGAYLGDWFVADEMLEIAYSPEKIKEKTVVKVRLTEEERFDHIYPQEVTKMEKHHLSYSPEKTILVCCKCHRRIHSDDSLAHLRPKKKSE